MWTWICWKIWLQHGFHQYGSFDFSNACFRTLSQKNLSTGLSSSRKGSITLAMLRAYDIACIVSKFPWWFQRWRIPCYLVLVWSFRGWWWFHVYHRHQAIRLLEGSFFLLCQTIGECHLHIWFGLGRIKQSHHISQCNCHPRQCSLVGLCSLVLVPRGDEGSVVSVFRMKGYTVVVIPYIKNGQVTGSPIGTGSSTPNLTFLSMTALTSSYQWMGIRMGKLCAVCVACGSILSPIGWPSMSIRVWCLQMSKLMRQ